MSIKQATASGRTGVSSSGPSSVREPAKAPTLAQTRAAVLQSAPNTAPDAESLRTHLAHADHAGPDTPRLPLREAPKYFRTFEQVKDAIFKLKADHADLVDVVDIGDSFEKTTGKANRDLLLMRITSKKPGPKAKVLFFGGQHAREIANPELLMRFVNWLVDNYGKDPQATMILDTREIEILPIMNPDGHAVIERGYTGAANGNLGKRKNTSGKDGEGTDLNRNWATKNWGKAGTSASPTSEVFSGLSPASEPETQALQAYIAQSKPQFMIDWHSYSELVLYPPDDDRSHTTPDQEHFVRVGKKIASFNRYTPQASIELYPTSGTSMWAYEKFGIPSFVIETGTAFHQNDAQYEDNWNRNFPVMKYVASIADDWRKTSAGPEVYAARIDGNGKLSAMAFDAATKAPAVKAEVVYDAKTPAGEGTAIPVEADGALSLKTRLVAAGREKRLMFVRAQSADGSWGPLTPLFEGERALRSNLVATRIAAKRQLEA